MNAANPTHKKKPSASFLKRAGDEGDALSIHSGAPRSVPHDSAVSPAGCVIQRVLPVAKATAEPACGAQAALSGSDW